MKPTKVYSFTIIYRNSVIGAQMTYNGIIHAHSHTAAVDEADVILDTMSHKTRKQIEKIIIDRTVGVPDDDKFIYVRKYHPIEP